MNLARPLLGATLRRVGFGLLVFPFALSAQNAPQSFSQRLEQAARAAANPLRVMSEPAAAARSGDPRGDSFTPVPTRPNAPPAARGPANGAQSPPGRRTENETPKAEQPREKLESFALSANVILGDGRSVRGRLHFRAPEKIVITHKRDEIAYRKTIRIRNLRSIEITQWKGEPVRKNRKGEWIYRFGPRESTLTLNGGLVLKENARLLPYFEKFTVHNGNGEVTLFSFWMDLLKPDGTWYTGITGPTNGLRRSGHKDVVQRIEFGTPDDHE